MFPGKVDHWEQSKSHGELVLQGHNRLNLECGMKSEESVVLALTTQVALFQGIKRRR